MNLIIVESPTKAKTIAKFLSPKEYKIESSFGHIRDLPPSKTGIDIENNFEPEYVIPDKAKKQVKKLKDLTKKASKVILAPDEDREGEAIAWHLTQALKIDPKKTDRIVFHEITKKAILEALKNPRKLDMKLVDAQQARRILDRLVGYNLSPFLWKKVARGLSAGRVQSVAVRLVVEKEREIQAFKIEEYWSITGIFDTDQKEKIEANLHKFKNKNIDKLEIKDKKQADNILKILNKANYAVKKVEKKKAKKNPPRPFTTSTLQITANNMLGFSAKKTMMVAQQLYEGLDLGGESGGLITYMRTDSLNLSEKFLNEAQDYLIKNHGKEYSLEKPRFFKTKSKGAQEAHEAIRPTEADREPEDIQSGLTNDQFRLYKLIWSRSIASQMPEAELDSTTIDIEAEKTDYEFRVKGQVLKFDGYLKIYQEKSKELQLPEVKEKEKLNLNKLNPEQHFTKPPARYSDATLVKVLEQNGIGRPSTYAPTISTIEARNYVKRDDNKKLQPTDIAFVVSDLLVNHFSNVVDYEFTAKMENNLDNIAEGKREWQPVIGDFYHPFKENLDQKSNELTKKDIMPEEKSEEKCDKCGAEMVIKTGRYGKFLACGAYPDCKNIKSLKKEVELDDDKKKELEDLEKKYKDEKCAKCGEDMAIKSGKFGPFLACSGYPKCKNIKSIKENNNSTGVKCPNCGKGEIVGKKSRRGLFYACDQYPDCKTSFWAKPNGKKCKKCDSLLVETKDGEKCSNKNCGKKKK